MRLLIASLLLILCSAPASSGMLSTRGEGVAQSTTFVISPTGNDSNLGTLASPFLTPGKAQTAARSARETIPDVTVYARGGTYPLTSSLALTSADSGSYGHPIVWSSYPAEKAVFSGGVQVTGWTVCTTADTICNSGNGTTYQATVTSPSNFREFYFCPDGTFATCLHRDRAHGVTYPTGFTFNTSTGALTAPATGIYSGMASWGNPTAVEIVGMNVWLMARCLAATISGVPPVTTLQTPCRTNWVNFFYLQYTGFGGVGNVWPYLIENAYELLGAAPCGSGSGCWYKNPTTNVLYYQPKAGENMTTGMSVVPSVDKVVTGSNLHDVTFNRLSFAFSTWLGPSTGGVGYIDAQSGQYCNGVVPCNFGAGGGIALEPALDFSGSSNRLTFTRNLFAHNAARALLFEHGAQNVTISANDFADNGGGSLQWGDTTDPAELNTALQTAFLTVKDNKFNSGGGWQYQDAQELFQAFARNSTITQNEFDHVKALPIITGWGGSQSEPPWVASSYSDNHSITNNYINGYCEADNIFDCAGIYNSGMIVSAYTISGNYIKGLGLGPQSSKAGIYPDEHSQFMTISGNVVDGPLTANNCTASAIPQGGCGIYIWTSTINHITATAPWYSTSSKNLDLGTLDSIAAPTVFTSGSPPAGAVTIINAAGISAGVTPGP